jgi:hypothetical protein
VDVGEAVGEAGAEMQQRAGRAHGHARIAVRRARHDPLEEPEHAAHARHAIERRHEMHLGRARIGEAHRHVARNERPHQAFGAVHVTSS